MLVGQTPAGAATCSLHHSPIGDTGSPPTEKVLTPQATPRPPTAPCTPSTSPFLRLGSVSRGSSAVGRGGSIDRSKMGGLPPNVGGRDPRITAERCGRSWGWAPKAAAKS